MDNEKQLTIKQLARIAGVSVRTLHYYDQIGLLPPRFVGKNRYRYYGEGELIKLQQILFFREFSFNLEQIKCLISKSDFNLRDTLITHRDTLSKEADRILKLIDTVNNTIASLNGEKTMNENEYFVGFSDEKQVQYQAYAEEHWDKKLVSQSVQRWNSLSEDGKKNLMAEGSRITSRIVEAVPLGYASPQVQQLVSEWHNYINRFYDCSYEILLGLGKGYTEHPDFIAFYRKIHPSMPEFLYEAIKRYCSSHGVIEE